ncbi:hypothetical protein PO909_000148 [Leuciscus waleckii]
MERNWKKTKLECLCLSRGFPAACRIQAVSRSDEGPSPGPDDNAVLKCQLVSPYGGSLCHSTDKALSGNSIRVSTPN